MTRKEKRAWERDKKLVQALSEYGRLTDQIERLVAYRAEQEAAVVELLDLTPDRAVSLGGFDYKLGVNMALEWELRRTKHSKSLDRLAEDMRCLHQIYARV